ncbi:hypothetical protein [Arthrobacter sp. MDT1-65]
MQQWMWAIPAVPLGIVAYIVLHKINTRGSGTNTRRLYLIVSLLLLAIIALLFVSVA